MTDVRFDAGQINRVITLLCVKDFSERVDFDGIAQRRAGAVRLDVADLVGCDSAARHRRFDDVDLRGTVGRGDSRRPSAVVDRRVTQYRQNAIPIGPRVGQPFQNDDAGTFAADVTIGVFVKRSTLPRRRNHPRPRQRNHRIGRDANVHRPGQRRVALARPQRRDRLVDRHHRG